MPSDAPRFCAVPCSPPASFVFDGSTDDMITLPSCDSIRPAPTPKIASAIAKPALVELDVDRAEQQDSRGADGDQPDLGDALGREAAASRGPASAAMNIVTDIGNSRLPVSNASRPSTTCR